MNTPLLTESDDALLRLETMIAQRADELSREFGMDRGRALEHWRQAEREVWETVEDPPA